MWLPIFRVSMLTSDTSRFPALGALPRSAGQERSQPQPRDPSRTVNGTAAARNANSPFVRPALAAATAPKLAATRL